MSPVGVYRRGSPPITVLAYRRGRAQGDMLWVQQMYEYTHGAFDPRRRMCSSRLYTIFYHEERPGSVSFTSQPPEVLSTKCPFLLACQARSARAPSVHGRGGGDAAAAADTVQAICVTDIERVISGCLLWSTVVGFSGLFHTFPAHSRSQMSSASSFLSFMYSTGLTFQLPRA